MKVPHVCHTTRFTSTSMQSEAYGTNMYRVLLFPYQSAVPILYPSIFLPMFRMSLPSIKTGLHPCSAPPTWDPPEFLSSSPSCAPPATRVPLRRLRPSGSPADAPPEDTYLHERCDWGVKSRATPTSSGGVTKEAELKQKCSPGPSGRSGV